MTVTFKILFGPYLSKCKVKEADSWMGYWSRSLRMLNYGVTFNLGSAKVCSPAKIETYFSYKKDIWIAVTE